MNLDFIEDFKNKLLSLPYAHYTGDRRNIMFRCPFCGDSIKNYNSTHFSVKVDVLDEHGLPIFHCFRCDIGGIFSPDVFRQLDIHDVTLLTSLSKHNKKSLRLNKHNKYQRDDKKSLIIPKVNSLSDLDKLSRLKLRYIEKRLGIDLDISDIYRYKIAINLLEILQYNNIKDFAYKKYMMDTLDAYYIGAISVNNEYINLRNVFPDKHKLDKRYFNYNIFNNYDNTKKHYIIPTKIDIMSDNIEINLTEGFYDLIGVFNHVKDQKTENQLYCAVCGSGFYSAIKYFLKKGIIDFKLNIYSDNESSKNMKFYNNLKYEIRDFYKGKINIYYNNKSKDFGVPKKDIYMSKITI